MADKVRLGLIGASVSGTWSARSHLPALQASADVELTAVCTTRADSAEAACRAWGARLAFDDWRKMIASPEIDAVAVVVRVPSHYAPTNAALEAGKHVYCEWPLGRTTAEAVELAALAEAKGPAGPRQSCLDAHEGTGRGRLCRRSDGRPRQPDARGCVVPTVAPHLAARRRARRQHIDHCQRPHGRRNALRRRRLPSALRGGGDPGEGVARHGTNTLLDVTSPDNVLLSGRLASGAVAPAHVGAIPFAGSGYRMEIYGRDGTLVATGEDSGN